MFHIFHHPIHPSPKVISAVIDIKTHPQQALANCFVIHVLQAPWVTAPPAHGRFEGWYQPEMVGCTKSPNRLIVVGVFLSFWDGQLTPTDDYRSALPSQSSRKLQQQEKLQPKDNEIFTGGFWFEDETFGIPWRDETWLLRIYIFCELETETLISWS